MLLTFPLHYQMTDWAGRPCLCRQRTWTRGFLQGGRYKSETRGLHNVDLIQADILYNFIQYVEKALGLQEGRFGNTGCWCQRFSLSAKFLFFSFFLLTPKF